MTRKHIYMARAVVTAGVLLSASLALADTSALQTQIDDRTQKIDQIQQEIAALQKELDTTNAQKQTLQSAIKTLDLSNKKITAQISLTQTQISKVNLQIQTLSGSIATTSDKMDSDSASVAAILRDLNENDLSPVALVLLQSESLSSIFDATAALATTREALRSQIAELSLLKTTLVNTRSSAQQKRDELASLKLDLTQQKAALAAAITQKNQLLSETKNKESNYQTLIATKKAQEAAFEDELNSLQNQLKGTVDEAALPSGGHGVLRWPLASIRVTQYFGNTAFAQQHASVYNGHGHSGVDFAASIGTRIMSAGSGVVIGTGNTDVGGCYSYGKWVLVKHYNGLSTLYAHLSVISVSKGQQVTAGQTVGYSGMTGYSTGPHLHFGVFASSVVEIMNLGEWYKKNGQKPTSACAKAGVSIPVAPLSGYLNPMPYLPTR